jgi:hypothetical protein
MSTRASIILSLAYVLLIGFWIVALFPRNEVERRAFWNGIYRVQAVSRPIYQP